MAHVATYKPSPLSFGSPRASPFRRPESPASPSPSLRPTTPNLSPTKNQTPLSSPTKPFSPLSSPSKLNPTPGSFEKSPALFDKSPAPSAPSTPLTARSGNSWTPRGVDALRNSSPTRAAAAENPAITTLGGGSRLRSSVLDGSDALAKLPAVQVREMREGFQILDQDNDGRVTREDVTEMLNNLGLDSSPSSLNDFFPSTNPTLFLPHYLSTLAAPLSQLSPPAELLAAFAAFDADDSGQIDIAELRDALVNTGGRSLVEHDVEKVLASFSGRRAFSAKSTTAARGEVFRYRDFATGLSGGAVHGDQSRNGDQVHNRK